MGTMTNDILLFVQKELMSIIKNKKDLQNVFIISGKLGMQKALPKFDFAT